MEFLGHEIQTQLNCLGICAAETNGGYGECSIFVFEA